MVYNSLKKLLEKFPFFLDKLSTSNFYKNEDVFNERFRDIYNELFKTYLQSKLEKHVLIWKEQDTAYDYDMHFSVSLPYLKSVSIVKNYDTIISEDVVNDDGSITTIEKPTNLDEVIYMETYDYTDEIDSFYYIHSDTSVNTIPEDKYRVIVETWEEYELEKGFPENNITQDNIYDHDHSLDEIGVLYNIPRKKYTPPEKTEDYPFTEPPYNNQTTEDDYHYLNRILYLIAHVINTPLPVLEIWKLLGLPVEEIQMINREKILCKMFDYGRHNYSALWTPAHGEHKDIWCIGLEEEIFFLVNVNNQTPIQLQDFTFDFRIINSFGRETYNTYTEYDVMTGDIIAESTNPFYIVPFVNGEMVDTVLLSNEKWTLNTEFINHGEAKFIFKCFKTLEEVENEKSKNNGEFHEYDDDVISDEIIISVMGCDSADWFVNPINGDDSNTGQSWEEAFKTVDKALTAIEGEKNIISLSNHDSHILNNVGVINENTKIISCPGSNPTVWGNNMLFFQIAQNNELYLQNVNLRYNCCRTHVDDYLFINHNINRNNLNVRLTEDSCLIPTTLSYDMWENIYVNEPFLFKGKITSADGGLNSAAIDLLIDGVKHTTIEASEGTEFSERLQLDTSTEHTIELKFPDTGDYCMSSVANVFNVIDYGIVEMGTNETDVSENVLIKTESGEELYEVKTDSNNDDNPSVLILESEDDYNLETAGEYDVIIFESTDSEEDLNLIFE